MFGQVCTGEVLIHLQCKFCVCKLQHFPLSNTTTVMTNPVFDKVTGELIGFSDLGDGL